MASTQAAADCSVSTTGMAFGNYDVFSTSALDSTATITVTCTSTTNVNLEISTGASHSFNPRIMQAGVTDDLNYNLYSNSNRTTIWGDGTGGTSFPTNRVRPSSAWTSTVYGRVPSQQDVSVGAYSDTVSVIIEF